MCILTIMCYRVVSPKLFNVKNDHTKYSWLIYIYHRSDFNCDLTTTKLLNYAIKTRPTILVYIYIYNWPEHIMLELPNHAHLGPYLFQTDQPYRLNGRHFVLRLWSIVWFNTSIISVRNTGLQVMAWKFHTNFHDYKMKLILVNSTIIRRFNFCFGVFKAWHCTVKSCSRSQVSIERNCL